MRRAGMGGGLALWLVAGAGWGAAQTPGAMVAAGVRAYDDVDLPAAATWLRRALRDSLPAAERVRALTYLGAAEVVRGAARRDSAVAAFRRLLLFDARQRIDPVVFPPAVVQLFAEVRRATKAVLVIPGTGAQGSIATIYSTSVHDLEARLLREDGGVVRNLYVGPVGDRMELGWDGRDTRGVYVPSGRYRLDVTSRPLGGGAILRVVQVPIEAELVIPEPLPLPAPLADSLLLPERTSRGKGLRSLGVGLAAGGAVVLLPGLIADGADPSPGRFAVAGAVSLAGIVGLFTQPGRPLAANVAANASRRAEWEREWAAVAAENELRRLGARVVVRAGAASVIEGGQP